MILFPLFSFTSVISSGESSELIKRQIYKEEEEELQSYKSRLCLLTPKTCIQCNSVGEKGIFAIERIYVPFFQSCVRPSFDVERQLKIGEKKRERYYAQEQRNERAGEELCQQGRDRSSFVDSIVPRPVCIIKPMALFIYKYISSHRESASSSFSDMYKTQF